MTQIKDIAQTPEGWEESVVGLAKQLEAMRKSYAQLAATFSQHLYLQQDELDLDGEDIVLIQTELAEIRQKINANTDKMMARIIINQAGPGPNEP